MQSNNYLIEGRSVLASLRAVVPNRPLSFTESLRVAELQANRLLELFGVREAPIPSDIVSELPRIRIEFRDLPSSGLSFWDGQNWIICLSRSEPRTRQRFTLLHEYKHIIDYRRVDTTGEGVRDRQADEQAEHVADYFAGCALMPKRLLKRAWGEGLQRPTVLAALFDVSPQAIAVRLAQLGLTEPQPRCSSRPRPHYASTYARRSRYQTYTNVSQHRRYEGSLV